MTYTPYLVANYRQGLTKNVEPWLAPGEATVKLENIYLKNGVYKKRQGTEVFGQLGKFATYTMSLNSGNTYVKTAFTSDLNAVVPFSCHIYDDADISIYDNGLGGFVSSFVDPASFNFINYKTGQIQITLYAPPTGILHLELHTAVNDPVRLLKELKRTDDVDLLCAMNSNRLSCYRPSRHYFANVANGDGTYDLFNSTNLVSSALYLDNLWLCDNSQLSGKVGGIKCFDGTVVSDPVLSLGTVGGTNYTIQAAKLVFAYKERIVFLNTIEGPSGFRFAQRARWSVPGVLPNSSEGWFDPAYSGIENQGGRNDAPTNEEIVSAEFLNDTLIVGFTNSIYALDSTPSPEIPFVWRKIAQGRRLMGPQGSCRLNDAVMFPSQSGLLACDGNKVQRIDESIPDFVFDITQRFTDKIFTFRDETNQQILLSCPLDGAENNNTILIYNFLDNAYSTFDFAATCIEDYLSDRGKTFDDYADFTFDDLSDLTWGDQSLQSGYPLILLGDQSGYVYNFTDEVTTDLKTWDQQRLPQTGTPFNFNILTKRFNPFVDQGQRVQLGFLEILADDEEQGEITANFQLNHQNSVAHSQIIRFNEFSEGIRTWHRADCFLTGHFVQLQLTLSNDQLVGLAGRSQVNIHGLNFYFRPMGKYS